MRAASGHSLPGDNQGLWQRHVQLPRGHWRREDAPCATRSAGWWESVTVTWSLAPAPDRNRAVPQRALAAAAAGMIAPVLADAAVTSTRRLLQRRSQGRLAASLLRRQLVFAVRDLPR